MRCLGESWALKTDTAGKEWGSLALAGLAEGGHRRFEERLSASCNCSMVRWEG